MADRSKDIKCPDCGCEFDASAVFVNGLIEGALNAVVNSGQAFEAAVADAVAIERERFSREFQANGCFTGDCPHDNVNDCVKGLEAVALAIIGAGGSVTLSTQGGKVGSVAMRRCIRCKGLFRDVFLGYRGCPDCRGVPDADAGKAGGYQPEDANDDRGMS